MRLLRFEDLKVVPWRNGGGVTREICARVDSALSGDFLWRLSIATVNADGPFSRFNGIDRTIAVLDGSGFELDLGEHTVSLTGSSDPFEFAGEAPVNARVVSGETSDLNAMTNRSFFRHRMRRLPSEPALTIKSDADDIVVVFGGTSAVEGLDEDFVSNRFDALVGIGAEFPVVVYPQSKAPTYLIEFQRV